MIRELHSWNTFQRIYHQLTLSFFLLILFPVCILAQNKPMNAALISQLKQKVKELAVTTQTITSAFTQEKKMEMISEKIVSKGKFYFRAERMLRWEYTEPFSYLIIISNDHITVKDENNVSHFDVSSNKIFLEINRIILGSIQGTLLNDEINFRTSFFDNEAAYIVKLYPLAPKLKESLAEIVIHFSHKDVSVDEVEMIEPGGDKTRIIFHDKIFNKPVADEKFIVR
ncbi:MAG: outer membrane lipoprotein carrier protein LolA [Bacteroidetes bacterium]|nr:outer membrane lipoprotein carrier protein LolA [Bacteroidota bacterium]